MDRGQAEDHQVKAEALLTPTFEEETPFKGNEILDWVVTELSKSKQDYWEFTMT